MIQIGETLRLTQQPLLQVSKLLFLPSIDDTLEVGSL